MLIKDYKKVPAAEVEQGAEGVKIRRIFVDDDGACNFHMRAFEVEPGGHTPLHTHEWEHEVFVLKGNGTVTSEKGQHEFKNGDAIFVPGNERHQFQNTGETTLEFICIIPSL